MLPKGWKKLSLATVAEVRTGVAKGKQNLKNPVELPYLRVANVQDGYIDTSTIKTIQIERDQIERYSLQAGDVLMTEGGDFDKLGRGDVWNGEISPCLHQNHVFAVRTDQSILTPHFLAALSASRYGKAYFLGCAKKSTNLASINSTQLKEFPVLVPPLVEQQKVTKILSIWDQAIKTTEKLLANSQQQKKSLGQQLLLGKKRLPGFNENWKEIRLSKLLCVRQEKTVPSDKNPLYSLTIEDGITAKTDRYDREALVKDTSTKKYKVVKPSDIVFNPANLRWGAINISRLSQNVVVSPIYEVLFVAEPTKNSASFLAQYLMASRQIAKFASMTEGTLVERQAVKLEPFLATKLNIPTTLAEQEKIDEVLSAADRTIEALQQKLIYLKQEKKSLMQQLLTGKCRVKVDES